MFGTGARHQIDRAAEGLGIHVRPRRLGELDAADDAGRKGIEGHRSAAAGGEEALDAGRRTPP